MAQKRKRKARRVERATRKKPVYRIISDPSWQLQLLHARDGWQTVAFCSSEEAAERALQKRRSTPRTALGDMLR